jgi:hypothetical protein
VIGLVLLLALGDLPEFTRKRNVPHHPASIMKDCPGDQARVIQSSIEAAIETGAPAYNDGDVETCFKLYEQTALTLNGKVKGCAGLKKALMAGVADAKQWDGVADKAWAMRDAFDGVLAVLPEKPETEAQAPRERQVVNLVSTVLKDCSTPAQARIKNTLESAITACTGDCYRLFAQAAANVRKEVSGCAGIKDAIRAAATEAKTYTSDTDRTGALRDTFDAVLRSLDNAR